MDVTVPPDLVGRVHFSHGVLRFQREAGSSLARVMGQLATLLLDEDGWRSFRVSRRRITCGALGRRMKHRGQYVRLVGPQPGRPVTLFVNGASLPMLHVIPQPPGRHPWTTAHITWLGRTVADLLEIPFQVEWDAEAWHLWNHDPLHRGRTELRLQVEESRRSFPVLHAYAPQEPPGTVTLDGATYHLRRSPLDGIRVRLGREAVHLPTWMFPYPAVQDLGVVFRHRPGTAIRDAILVIVCQDRAIDALQIRGASAVEAARVRWLAETLELQAQRARHHDPGSEADVPRSLLGLRPG